MTAMTKNVAPPSGATSETQAPVPPGASEAIPAPAWPDRFLLILGAICFLLLAGLICLDFFRALWRL